MEETELPYISKIIRSEFVSLFNIYRCFTHDQQVTAIQFESKEDDLFSLVLLLKDMPGPSIDGQSSSKISPFLKDLD